MPATNTPNARKSFSNKLVTSVRFSQAKKYRAYSSYRAMFLRGKDTKQIARYFGVSESVVYNTLARVDATW